MGTIFKLIIEDDEGKTTVYPLADGEISIGRREGNTIRLMERNVSRRHAKLLRNNGTVFIEDLDSYNGIRINGERITGKYEVNEGDLVEIGDYHLALQRTELKDDSNKAAMAAPDQPSWPQVGTMPDLALSQLDDVRGGRSPTVRDTIVDQPAPPQLPQAALAQTLNERANPPDLGPQPLVRPPPRDGNAPRELPPFPGPGGQVLSKPPLVPPVSPTADTKDLVPAASKTLSPGPTRVSSVPRLICVSTQYAGKEFALTRPELIIGRVEDNDVVIEHRSVSRNHAKILFDGKTHKIIDLQSANGILVNGEEYAMTDLRKGDLIELGHVRFRFIPAEEGFDPTEDECREMREAGVEPPPSRATAVTQPNASPLLRAPEGGGGEQFSAFDPSMAQTVTDTPLSALNEPAPRIEAKTVPTSVRTNGHPTATAAKPDVVKRATEDERPTEINRVARGPASNQAQLPIPAGDTEPMAKPRPRADSVARPPKSGLPIGMLLGGVFVLLALVIGGYVLFGKSGPGPHDLELARLYEAGQYRAVQDYALRHMADFTDLARAKSIVEAAQSKADPVEPPPPPAIDKIEPETEETLPDGDVPPDGEVEEDPSGAKRPRPAVNNKTLLLKKRREEADVQFRQGKTMTLNGDLSNAEKALKGCLKLQPDHANCHRGLGVVYAQLGDTARACAYYKKYLELLPNASDAESVRQAIRDGACPP